MAAWGVILPFNLIHSATGQNEKGGGPEISALARRREV
jgi:hypothetical protein